LDATQISFLRQVHKRKDVMIVLMGNPYLLKDYCDVRSAIVGYEDNSYTQQAMADILLKRKEPSGRLPVTPCDGIQPGGTGSIVVPDRGMPRIETADTADGVPWQLYKVYHVEDAG